jgi:hypothetical protein
VDWKTTHPLLARLSADDLNSWIADLSPEVPSIRLVPDSMSMTIATLPAGTPDIITPEIITPDKGDSLLAIQRIGRGRIVWCQLRLGSWTTDPRSQILLGNALDDLSTPAVAGSQRRRSTVAPEHTVPVIRTRFPMVLTPGGDER